MGISASRLFAVLVALGLVLPAGADADIAAIHVRSSAQFAAAVSALRDTGGTIRLHRNYYGGELVVGSRSAKPLRIVGERGVRVESLLLERTQHVSVGRLTIAPIRQDAWLSVSRSRHIEVHDVLVTAERTPYRATLHIPDSSHVLVRRSEFRRCGDRSELFSNCLHLQQRARHVQVVDNWFHDCRGCDFVHGRFGVDLTLRGNRFERALPCRMNRHRCGHQDLVSLFSGHRLLVEGNTFGVYRLGAAQLYLIRAVDRVTIVNNVFRGTDRRVPGYEARVAIIIGSRGSTRVPRRVTVVNNTILTGAAPNRRLRGLDPDERRLLEAPAKQAAGAREQRHRPARAPAPRVQRRAHGSDQRRPARKPLSRLQPPRPGSPRRERPPDSCLEDAHRPREQTVCAAVRHRGAPAWAQARHRRLRVPRPKAAR